MKRTVFEGKIFSIVWEEKTLPSGASLVYETVTAPDVVRVYPKFGEKILLIREHRPELGQTIIRTVSGRIDDGEPPEAAALRELREELGGVGVGPRVFARSRPILKVSSVVHHVFVEVEALGMAEPEDGETIESFPVAVDDLEDLVWRGSVTEDVIALQLLRLHRWGGEPPKE